MTMSMEPIEIAAPTLPVRTLRPMVKTRKYVPKNSAVYLATAECWYTCFGGACIMEGETSIIRRERPLSLTFLLE